MDDGWKVVEIEPEIIAVNGNGHAPAPINGNGTNGHNAAGIGPTVELVLGNGHHANGNGNSHDDEAPEPQQSLFSWAEFMAVEPVKPKRRKQQATARDPLDVDARPRRKGGGYRCWSDALPWLVIYAAFLAFHQIYARVWIVHRDNYQLVGQYPN